MRDTKLGLGFRVYEAMLPFGHYIPLKKTVLITKTSQVRQLFSLTPKLTRHKVY